MGTGKRIEDEKRAQGRSESSFWINFIESAWEAQLASWPDSYFI
jgi:hypothetical protein